MDRRRRFCALIAAALLSLFAGPLWAQAPTQSGGPGGGGASRPNFSRESLRQGNQRWREMSPGDRQRFRSNVERWQQLPPDARNDLRAREISRQQLLKREAEGAMRDAGLQIEAEKRAQFEQRYLEERRRVEQELRRELQEKRQREMAPVVERLKKEFTEPSVAPSAQATPTISRSPAK